jgi:hypothetical protein
MVKTAALVFGIVFLLVGLLGFFTTGGMSMEADPATAPRLLGLFPVNALHNAVHAGFGIWGLLAARSWGGARSYLRIGGAIYLVLAVLGLVSPSGFGLVPIGGNDIWLHVVLGAAMAGIGFTSQPAPPTATYSTDGDRAV